MARKIKTIWHTFFDISLFGSLFFTFLSMFTESVAKQAGYILFGLSPIHYITLMFDVGFIICIFLIIYSKNNELFVKVVD